MAPQFGFKGILQSLYNLFFGRLRLKKQYITRPRSIAIRHLDAGSCADIEVELTACTNPLYDMQYLGLHITPSPRHADVLLVTGPFVRSMEGAALECLHAMPEPRRVVTAGDGLDEETSLFADSYAFLPLPLEMEAVRVAHVGGDPPSPGDLIEVLQNLKTE